MSHRICRHIRNNSDTTNKISFLYITGITDKKPEDMGGIIRLELSDDSFIMVEITNTSTESVNSADDYMQQFVKLLKEDNSDIKYTVSEISRADSGRYDFKTVDISYNYEGKDRVLSLSCADGSNGVIYRIYYSGITDEAEKLKHYIVIFYGRLELAKKNGGQYEENRKES